MSGLHDHPHSQDWVGGLRECRPTPKEEARMNPLPHLWTPAGVEYLKRAGYSPAQIERLQAGEDEPLSLTERQRARLLAVLVDELGGPVGAGVLLARIEREV